MEKEETATSSWTRQMVNWPRVPYSALILLLITYKSSSIPEQPILLAIILYVFEGNVRIPWRSQRELLGLPHNEALESPFQRDVCKTTRRTNVSTTAPEKGAERGKMEGSSEFPLYQVVNLWQL